MWWQYDNLPSRAPYDWSPATRGERPWDLIDFHLDLGCGRVPKARMGIDRKLSEGATDIVMDLDTLTLNRGETERCGRSVSTLVDQPGYLPFPDGSIESIITHHCFEHIGPGFERLMEECYRVLKWGGVIRIVTPLFPSYAAVSEYDHKRFFMEGTLMGFCQEIAGPSITDAFAERYNMACFRQVDEEMSPPAEPGQEWTKEDVREIRTTLFKYEEGGGEADPQAFMPEVKDAAHISAQDGGDDPIRGEITQGAEAGGGDPGAGDEPQAGSQNGDSAAAEAARAQVPEGGGGPETTFASVCVLSYERLSLLKECIGSMIAGAQAPFELIVHDDGSTDPALRQWLYQMLEEGVISTLLMNSPGWNEGQGIAMNRMAAVAKGDPIIKCDQDLVFNDGWLRQVNDVLQTNWARTDEISEPLIGALGIFKYPIDPVDSDKMFIKDWVHFDEVEDFVGSFIAMPRAAWTCWGPWGERSPAFAEDAVYKKLIQDAEGWCCALTKTDLARNQGFGVGPSTVVVAEGVVKEIKDAPKVLEVAT